MDKSSDSIENIIKKAVESGRISAERASKDAYKATERRLYALPVIRERLKDNREKLEEFGRYGPRERSRSITRFVKSGVRLSPEEIFEAVVIDLEANIAADEYEVETMERALSTIADDAYYQTVTGRYIDDLPDEHIAELIPCDQSTVWRHRKRLVQRLAVWLYGAQDI